MTVWDQQDSTHAMLAAPHETTVAAINFTGAETMNLRPPTLETETALFAEGFIAVGAMDEVGRGSAVGPCCVGVVVIGPDVGPVPEGLRDSKLLSAPQREALVNPIQHWAAESRVGFASAKEIDEFGLTWGLRLAGLRALSALSRRPDIIVLDGRHDWLSLPSPSLVDPSCPQVAIPAVRTMIKADLTCASVAAASVVAKVQRDDAMRLLAREAPGYDIERNMGYVTPAHQVALRRLGPSPHHRTSWRLPARDASSDAPID